MACKSSYICKTNQEYDYSKELNWLSFLKKHQTRESTQTHLVKLFTTHDDFVEIDIGDGVGGKQYIIFIATHQFPPLKMAIVIAIRMYNFTIVGAVLHTLSVFNKITLKVKIVKLHMKSLK